MKDLSNLPGPLDAVTITASNQSLEIARLKAERKATETTWRAAYGKAEVAILKLEAERDELLKIIRRAAKPPCKYIEGFGGVCDTSLGSGDNCCVPCLSRAVIAKTEKGQ